MSAPPSAPAPVPSLLESTEQAYTQAAQGTLSVVDLINATQRLSDANHFDIAIKLYKIWLEHSNSPVAYAVQFNLGVLLANSHDDAGAEQAYRAALAQNPTFIEASLNLGTLLERRQRPEEALATWRAILTFGNLKVPNNQPLHIQALNNLGRLLELRNALPEAEAMLTRSLKLAPGQKNVITHWVHLRQKQCAWPVFSPSPGIAQDDMMRATSVLAMLSVTDDPAVQLATARAWVEEKVLRDARPMSRRQSYGHQRLRIGYLSSDFCAHAVSILTAELYGLHDRAQVEVFGFCWSQEDGSALRARVVAGMDHHISIASISDQEAARLIRLHEIDILVDLQGLTLGARHDILSWRPAPVQISWLGFPGTTALPEIDYVIADNFVLPPELEPFFTEKPLRMPQVFQINDRQREIGPRPSRQSCGLPEEAFVFCCFNGNFKFTPELFDAWMRILKQVPNSVLWLVTDNATVRENLCQRAEKNGVARSRLHFAGRVPPADYLARFQVADLFLDTFPFGAGTTASDALWAGLPLLTLVGRSFASRMAGSLLQAVDLPELITYSLEQYQARAVALALERPLIESLKTRLNAGRNGQRNDQQLSCALFDSPRFVRELETLYRKLIDDLPVAQAISSPSAAALGYIEMPNAAANLDLPCNFTDRRYVVVAPPYQHNSAGIRVLYDLQKWLVRAGLDAIVCTWFQGYPVEQFADDIVIYPEVAPGNILNAKRVIRYLLNVPGKLGHGLKTYDKNEIMVAYNQDLAPYANGMMLQVPATEPFFNATGAIKTCNAMYVGKGQNLGLHPPDCIEITKTWPATRRDVAQFLRSVKTLYMYDNFSILGHEAELCGCEVKLVAQDGTLSEYPKTFFPTLDQFKQQLHEFIEMTRRM